VQKSRMLSLNLRLSRVKFTYKPSSVFAGGEW
jgi:hypothetical protein